MTQVSYGDKTFIERLDNELSQKHEPVKNSKDGSDRPWTTTYMVPAGKGRIVKVRIFFNTQTKRGTLKLKPIHTE